MSAEDTKITVAHLVLTLDRIDQWLLAVRKGLEALPQDQEVDIKVGDLQNDLEVKQLFIASPC